MIEFDILTIFPDFFDCFLKESLIEKALKEQLIEINIHNLRDYTDDPHNAVDDRPFGGGFGMVYKVEPIYKAVKEIEDKDKKTKVILFTPRGETLNQRKITKYADCEQIILICARYEGVDERVAEFVADEEISIGEYVLLGGEVPAMALVEATSRLVPGVIGEPEILKERVTKKGDFKEYVQYTRPQVFKNNEGEEWKVPEVLLSGHHRKIKKWRKRHSKKVGEKSIEKDN